MKCKIIFLAPSLISLLFCFSENKSKNIIVKNNIYRKSFVGDFRSELETKLSSFVELHNTESEDKIKTCECDGIYFINKFNGKEAYYVDFIGDNGYMVVDEDWEISNLETLGYHDGIGDFAGDIFFNNDGTISGKHDGIEVNFSYLSEQKEGNKPNNVSGDAGNSSFIHDIDAYIASVHPDFDYENIFYLIDSYYRSRQYHTSVLYRYSYDSNMNYLSPTSEGNCLLNATYSAILNGANHGWNSNAYSLGNQTFDSSSLASDRQLSTLTFNRSIHYSENGNQFDIAINSYDWGMKTDYYLDGSFTIPKLYWHIRERALDFGYCCEGLLNSKVPDLIGHAYIKSGYSNPGTTYSLNVDSVTSNVRNSIPGIVATTSSNTYGNHGMAIYGYKVYSVTQSFLWFTEKYYKYVFLVDDGHTESGYCPVSDSAIFAGNLNSNNSYTTSQKEQVRWYDPTCATSNEYYSQNRTNMTHS